MTLQQLEYVVALDIYRHFVTAAEKCFVTQPTITIQVKKLEDQIGFLIFDKSKSPFVPTELGEKFIVKAKNILKETTELKNLVNKELDDIKGTFKIGVIPTISPYLIPLISGSFSQKYSDTFLIIEEMKSEEIIEALQKNEIDIGILVTPLNENLLREVVLYNEPFVFYCHQDHVLSSYENIDANEIDKLNDLWLLNSGHCFRNQVLNICTANKNSKNIQFQSGSIEALKKMVDNYGGFTLVPEMAMNDSDNGISIEFKEPKPIREVSLVVNYTFAKETILEVLRKEILKTIPVSFEKNTRFYKVAWR